MRAGGRAGGREKAAGLGRERGAEAGLAAWAPAAGRPAPACRPTCQALAASKGAGTAGQALRRARSGGERTTYRGRARSGQTRRAAGADSKTGSKTETPEESKRERDSLAWLPEYSKSHRSRSGPGTTSSATFLLKGPAPKGAGRAGIDRLSAISGAVLSLLVAHPWKRHGSGRATGRITARSFPTWRDLAAARGGGSLLPRPGHASQPATATAVPPPPPCPLSPIFEYLPTPPGPHTHRAGVAFRPAGLAQRVCPPVLRKTA